MIVVAAAILIRDDRILLARRRPEKKLGGFWEFPGGKLEAGETLAACLQRELKEELGIETVVGDHLTECEHQYDFGKIRLVGLAARHVRGEFAPRDHDELSWVKPAELLNYKLAPADVPIARWLAGRDLQEDRFTVKL